MDPFPFNGTIAPGSFPRFVADLYRHGATGSLKVEGTTYRKALYFRNGRILFGSSNDPRDQLGAILVATGRITEAQVEAESQKVGPGKPLARVLADGGLVGQKELAEAARMKVERILADLLTYSAGTFEFEDGVLPKGAVDLRLSTPRLFLSAALAAGNDLPPMVIGPGEQVLRRREGGDAILTELENDASSFARALDGQRAVGSVGSGVGLGTRESERIASGLVLLGLAEHIGAPQIDDGPPSEPFDPFTLLSESSSNLGLDPGGETIRATSLDDLPLAQPRGSREEEVAEQPAFSFEETDKTTIFPPEPIQLDTESDSGPVVKTAVGISTADLGLDRTRLNTQLDLPEEKPPELEIRFDPDPEPANVQVDHAVTSPARVSEPRERTIRTPPPTVVPAPSTAPPPFLRPQVPIRVARASRSSVPGLLVALGLIAAAGVALWLWLNTSGREQVARSPEPSAAASPASAEATPQPTADAATSAPASPAPRRRAAEVLPTPPPPAPRTATAATPPPQRPRQVVSTGDAALQLLRQGDVAGAARSFAGSTAREGYTIQLLVACSPQTAVKAAEQVTTGDLFVLPLRYQDRDCYRVVFGRYPTARRRVGRPRTLGPGLFYPRGRAASRGEPGRDRSVASARPCHGTRRPWPRALPGTSASACSRAASSPGRCPPGCAGCPRRGRAGARLLPGRP